MWHRHSCLCEVSHDLRLQALMGAGSGRGTDKSVCATSVPRLRFKVRLRFKCCEKCSLTPDFNLDTTLAAILPACLGARVKIADQHFDRNSVHSRSPAKPHDP